MTARAIKLGNGRRIGLGAYVAAWRTLRTMAPDTWIPTCPDGWSGTAADALAQCRAGMHDRINRHIASYGRGRKWAPDWQRETLQAAGRLNTPRLIIDWLPMHLKTRFAHRLRCNL